MSMLSSLNLAYLHLRLEELFGSNDWFGGKNILFVGYILQLQPVNGDPVFEKVSQKSHSLRLGSATSINIWKDSVVYDELTINEQKSDQGYSLLLDGVRCGFPTDETLTTPKQRVIQVSVVDKLKEFKEAGQTPIICLFSTCKQCDGLNSEMLKCPPSKVKVIQCTDDIDQMSTTR